MESTTSQDGPGGGSHELDYSDLSPNMRTDAFTWIEKHGPKMKELRTVVIATISELQKIVKWAKPASCHGIKRLQAIRYHDLPITLTDIKQFPKPEDFLVSIDRMDEIDELALRRILHYECMYAYLEPTSKFATSIVKAMCTLHIATLATKDQDIKIDQLDDLSDIALSALQEKIYHEILSMRKSVCESAGIIGAFLKGYRNVIESLRRDRDAVDAEERRIWETLSADDRKAKLYGLIHQMSDNWEQSKMVNLEQGAYTAQWKHIRALEMYDAVSGLLRQREEADKMWTALKSINRYP